MGTERANSLVRTRAELGRVIEAERKSRLQQRWYGSA